MCNTWWRPNDDRAPSTFRSAEIAHLQSVTGRDRSLFSCALCLCLHTSMGENVLRHSTPHPRRGSFHIWASSPKTIMAPIVSVSAKYSIRCLCLFTSPQLCFVSDVVTCFCPLGELVFCCNCAPFTRLACLGTGVFSAVSRPTAVIFILMVSVPRSCFVLLSL